jgi:hypothetical protein
MAVCDRHCQVTSGKQAKINSCLSDSLGVNCIKCRKINKHRDFCFMQHNSLSLEICDVRGEDIHCPKDDNAMEIKSVYSSQNITQQINHDDHKSIASRPPSQQLRSKLFITLTLYFAFFVSRNLFTLTTARDFLGYLGDNEKGNLYLSIFILLLPASMVALPFIDVILEKYGFHIGI